MVRPTRLAAPPVPPSSRHGPLWLPPSRPAAPKLGRRPHSAPRPPRRTREPFLALLPWPTASPTPKKPPKLPRTIFRLVPPTHQPVPMRQSFSQATPIQQDAPRVTTTAQFVDEALKSLLVQSSLQSTHLDPHHSHLPALAPPFSDLSVGQSPNLSSIYLQYLQSSTTPTDFAKRLHNLVIQRLPRQRADQIAELHSRHPTLRHLVSTDSYNVLIRFSYLANRYDQARTLLDEMAERGLERNLRTYELIMCSYQALDKTRGVNLTLQKIRNLGLRPSPEAWVSLLAIRPRQRARVRYQDSMGPPPANQPGFSIDRFVHGWRWGTHHLNADGKAIVTAAKVLMDAGHWSHACRFIDSALKLSVDSPHPLSSFWVNEFLHALLYGLYNAKRDFSKRARAGGIAPRDVGDARRTQLQVTLQSTEQDEDDDQVDSLIPPPIPSAIHFVEDFIDRHRAAYSIRTTPPILLNCLRVDTSFAPSEAEAILDRWIARYGLDKAQLGSRVAVRLGHVTASWLTKALAAGKREEVEKEYGLMVGFWARRLEQMLAQGPVDGRAIRGLHAFYAAHRTSSIGVSLKRVSKLGRKIGATEDPFRAFVKALGLGKDQWKEGLVLERAKRRKGRTHVVYSWGSERPGSKPIQFKGRNCRYRQAPSRYPSDFTACNRRKFEGSGVTPSEMELRGTQHPTGTQLLAIPCFTPTIANDLGTQLPTIPHFTPTTPTTANNSRRATDMPQKSERLQAIKDLTQIASKHWTRDISSSPNMSPLG